MSEFVNKIQLSFNEEGYNKALENAEKIALELTGKFNKVSEFLDKELTGADIMSIVSTKMRFIDDYLTPAFQFPQADKEFNLKAMGRYEEYNKIKEVVDSIGTAVFDSYGFDWVDSAVILPSARKDVLQERYKRYTTNEKQNEVLQELTLLIEQLHKLKNLGIMDSLQVNKIANVYPYLKAEAKDKGYEFEIHTSNLLYIK